MVDLDVKSDVVEADEYKDPVKIKEEDHDEMRKIQALSDGLVKYRQEMGRLLQVLDNMKEQANKTERELADTRRNLAQKYNLEKIGMGQWAVDFEKKEFVKVSPRTPPIP